MAEAAVIIILALIMAYIYSRTEHPKGYAFLNISAGVITLTAGKFLFAGGIGTITAYSAGLSAVLGVPGAVLCLLSSNLV